MASKASDNMAKPIKVGIPRNSVSSLWRRKRFDQWRELSNRCPTQPVVQNRSNFERSGVPARVMFYQEGSWVDFSSDVLEQLRSAFGDRRPALEVRVEGSNYLFDFIWMLQTDCETGTKRSIAWIDENGKCFFPIKFMGEDIAIDEEDQNPMNIEISIQINGEPVAGKGELKRKRESAQLNKENGDEIEVSSTGPRRNEEAPKRQRLIEEETQSPVWRNTALLKEGERNYEIVSHLFSTALRQNEPDATITAIHHVTRSGPLEKARMEGYRKQKEVTSNARGSSNEILAWYGGLAKEIGRILEYGFSVPSRVPESDRYGVGVYFSPVGLPHSSAALLEADDNGEKHLILCRVILGNIEQVAAGSQQYSPSSEDFDTGVDDPENPKWHVVWCRDMNTRIFPLCVVSYRTPKHARVELDGVASSEQPFVNLLSKIKGSLSVSKVQEVDSLYGAYKAGKLARNVLTRELRSVVGDKLLLSTIQEIRGCKRGSSKIC